MNTHFFLMQIATIGVGTIYFLTEALPPDMGMWKSVTEFGAIGALLVVIYLMLRFMKEENEANRIVLREQSEAIKAMHSDILRCPGRNKE